MEAATAKPPGESGLLERERELAALGRLVDEAAAGEARIALIEGPAGIGKSRLLAETRRRAADSGLRVLQARGGELEREFPFGVVRQLLEPALIDPEVRERVLAGAAAPARAVFEPLSADPAADGGDASFAALHGLYWLTVNLAADEPLMLAIDDLHWTDRPSLRFLLYLARRLEGLPVLVAATIRPAEPDADASLLGELAADPLTVPVRPVHLSEPAVADLVRQRFGDGAEEAFAAACHAATGGNPLLLNELLKALETEGVTASRANVGVVADIGPRAASRAVLLRLARLPGSTAEVARAIAVLGENADLTSAAALAGIDEAEAAAATGALARAEIIRREPPLGFVHPLVRAAVYHDIPPGERELRHERAAAMLIEAGAPAEQIAAHVLATPPRGDPERFDLLRTAAAESLSKGAAESAVAYLTRSLDEAPSPGIRGKLLLELGQAETRVNGPAAAEHLRQALDLLEDPLDRARAAASLARTVLFTGSPEETKQLARQAAAELPEDALDLRQRLEALELFAEMFGSDWSDSDRFERYRERPPGDGPGPSMLMGLAAWNAALKGEPAGECVKLALDALEDGRIVADEGSLMAFPPTIVLTLADHDGALAAWDSIRRRLANRGSLFSAGGVHVWRGHTLWLRGEVEEALTQLVAAREVLDMWGDPGEGATYSGSLRANVLIEHGELDEARAVLDRAGYPDGGSERALLWLVARARLHMRDEPAEALRVLDDLGGRLAGRDNPTFFPWRILRAQALERLGRHDEAVEAAEGAAEVAARWGAAGAVGAALRVQGTIEGEDGVERLEEATRILAGAPARLEHAKALTALGAALRRARRPRDARDPLRRGLELAEICGSPPVAEHARAELHAAGVRPRASALSGPESLTPSERRVADLAAEGQTNRDIAQALFVTPKTVEVHLSNSYRKLGIGSRRELEKALTPA